MSFDLLFRLRAVTRTLPHVSTIGSAYLREGDRSRMHREVRSWNNAATFWCASEIARNRVGAAAQP